MTRRDILAFDTMLPINTFAGTESFTNPCDPLSVLQS